MASSKFVNPFMLGADPEIVLLDPPHLVNVSGGGPNDPTGYFGYDHNGWVVEPHPTPNVSARQVCHNIKNSLDYLAYKFGKYRFRAGAHIQAPERAITLGGHVHLDIRDLTGDQILAMDVFRETLENLDILPMEECKRRTLSGMGYGAAGDIRREHGHVEYRSMCSWLYSRKVSMLAITGIKLAAVAPQTLPTKPMDSIKKLATWMEGFKEADDDVKWIFDRGYFDRSMVVDPEQSVVSAWKADAEMGQLLFETFKERRIQEMKEQIHRRARALNGTATQIDTGLPQEAQEGLGLDQQATFQQMLRTPQAATPPIRRPTRGVNPPVERDFLE